MVYNARRRDFPPFSTCAEEAMSGAGAPRSLRQALALIRKETRK